MTAPQADAPQELQFRLKVDAAHCDRAAQGLRLMAQYQYRCLVHRYEANAWVKQAQRGLRKLLPLLMVAVIIAGAAAIWLGCTNGPSGHVFFWLAAILFLEALALWLLPRRADRIAASLRNTSERYFGNRVAARMRKTRRTAPFEGVYDLRGDLLTYSRIEHGQWTPRWHRHLDKFKHRGVALHAPGVLTIFKKPGSVVPAILILTADDGAMVTAIRALGWTVREIDMASGELRSRA